MWITEPVRCDPRLCSNIGTRQGEERLCTLTGPGAKINTMIPTINQVNPLTRMRWKPDYTTSSPGPWIPGTTDPARPPKFGVPEAM